MAKKTKEPNIFWLLNQRFRLDIEKPSDPTDPIPFRVDRTTEMSATFEPREESFYIGGFVTEGVVTVTFGDGGRVFDGIGEMKEFAAVWYYLCKAFVKWGILPDEPGVAQDKTGDLR